jgi:hypothetical protein
MRESPQVVCRVTARVPRAENIAIARKIGVIVATVVTTSVPHWVVSAHASPCKASETLEMQMGGRGARVSPLLR